MRFLRKVCCLGFALRLVRSVLFERKRVYTILLSNDSEFWKTSLIFSLKNPFFVSKERHEKLFGFFSIFQLVGLMRF